MNVAVSRAALCVCIFCSIAQVVIERGPMPLAVRGSQTAPLKLIIQTDEKDIAAKMGHRDVSNLTPAMIAIETLEQIKDYLKRKEGKTV